MEIQQNMANVMRVMKQTRGVSLAEFSSELEISRSTLQEYLSGTGNPNLSTVEHLAKKLGIDPITLLTGVFTFDELQALLIVVDQLRFLSALEGQRRVLFAKKFLELVRLWNESANDG